MSITQAIFLLEYRQTDGRHSWPLYPLLGCCQHWV